MIEKITTAKLSHKQIPKRLACADMIGNNFLDILHFNIITQLPKVIDDGPHTGWKFMHPIHKFSQRSFP